MTTTSQRIRLADSGAYIDARCHRHRLELLHTRVPADLLGSGAGTALMEEAIAVACRHRLTIVPTCPFTRGWLLTHPNLSGKVAVDWADGCADDTGGVER